MDARVEPAHDESERTTSGVAGVARQHAERDADLLERLLVFLVGVLAEDQLRIGRTMQPPVLLNLVLELSRRPAGVAQGEQRAGRAIAAGYGLENVERGGEADAFVDRQGRILD